MIIRAGKVVIEDTMDKLIDDGESVRCGCPSPELTMKVHVDGDPWYYSIYSCSCGNQIHVRGDRERGDHLM